ncbi:hypothetical protein C5B85_04210 [Pseudoclavibacter sp. AY1F1]|uniref:DUF4350 domain-containing protein n=1 Tax=Pseudoclavibacter sp. AY1F1 TaxID=2080583 RepID=UPI000CE850B8|nr:DUF4350 domain-containing protein [Pseudoclavibacter sp. AY1F1]PPF45878.1 hypothetical protein C5B85_04210 [Pseudoclavibacter sp. AY1F1]
MTEVQGATPTFSERVRRARPWLLIAAGAVVVAVSSALIAGGVANANSPYLEVDSARPNGAKAIFTVLGDQGVQTSTATTADEARSQLEDAGGETTLVVHDRDGIAVDDLAARISELDADRILLIAPGRGLLEALGGSITLGGLGAVGEEDDAVDAGPDCTLPLGEIAPQISQRGARLYQLDDEAATVGSACYPESERFAYVETTLPSGTELAALGATDNLSNGEVLSVANAAMGLAVLGQTESLVWYVPGAADAEAAFGVEPSLDSFVPPWLTPTILIALATLLGVMVWRGRRFGPLVEERLPVLVEASETMHGRGRLYAQQRARLRAIDNLRVGTTTRLAKSLGLARASHVQEIITSSAAILGANRAAVSWTLLDAVPGSEAELLNLSQALLTLERAVAAAADPSGVRTSSPASNAPDQSTTDPSATDPSAPAEKSGDPV